MNSRLDLSEPIHAFDNVNFIYVDPVDETLWMCSGLATGKRMLASNPIQHISIEISHPAPQIAGGAQILFVPETNVIGHVIDIENYKGGVGGTAFLSKEIKSQVIGGGKRVYDQTDERWPNYAILVKNNWVGRDRPLTRAEMLTMGIENDHIAVPEGFAVRFSPSGEPYLEVVDISQFDDDDFDIQGGDVFIN